LFKVLKTGDTVWSFDTKSGRLASGNYPGASHETLNVKLLKQGRYNITDEDEIEDFFSDTFINGYMVNDTLYVYDMFINDKIQPAPPKFLRSVERKLKPADVVRIRIQESISEKYKRDYRKEYDNYHAKPEQRQRNASRKRARRAMERAGKCKPFDKKDVHHKNHDAMNNHKSNLAVTDIATNRADNKCAVHGDRVDYTERFGLKPFRNYERLDEKLLLINNGKRNGQIVFLAGGAGSGKGFAVNNFLEGGKFKIRDVDAWKEAFIEIDKIKKNHPEIRGLDLSNPVDVGKLHIFIKKKGIKKKTLEAFLQDKSKDFLPNILFDITFKTIFDMSQTLPKLIAAGYDPSNIHIVWVLTDYKVAIKRNQNRPRVVPNDILLDTHSGAARTVFDLTRGKHNPKGFNGGMYVILNNQENTIFYADPKSGKPLNGAAGRATVIKDFKYLTLKKPGKAFISDKAVKAEVLSWIQANVPKTDKLDDIFSAG